MPVLNLTPAFMATGLVCPPGKRRIEYCDAKVAGLLIECRSGADAVPTWYWRRKVNGKTTYKNLGPLTNMDLETARKQVTLLKAEHAMVSKRIPATELAKGNMPLDVFMRNHYFPHAELHKRSHKRDDQLYRIRIAPKFGHLQLNQITRHAVQQFHLALVKEHSLSPASAAAFKK